MIEVSRSLLLMHPDPKFRARIAQIAKRDFLVESLSSWGEVAAALCKTSLVSVAVVDPYLGVHKRAHLAPELRALLWNFPSVTVIAGVEMRPDRCADFRMLGEWGVTEIFSVENGNLEMLARVLRSARGRPLQSLLQRSLPSRTGGRARSILDAAAEVASMGGHPRDLARKLYASKRTLLRWCDREGLPTPRQLLVWMRVLLAAELLEDPRRSVESVALSCGYTSDSGLRRALYDCIQMSPTALQDRGAVETASHAFREVLTRMSRTRQKQAKHAPLSQKE
jgi:AraC-like DNA-binding protein